VLRVSSPPGHCKLCELSDFSDPGLRELIRDVYASESDGHGPDFPAGREHRKHWEVAMAIRALDGGGALRDDARVLGVGAGYEATIYWLTRKVARVVATDLYASASPWVGGGGDPEMLDDPGRFYDGPWNPERLEVLNMNALELEFEDESFDGVFSSGSIEHFGPRADVRKGIEEIYRVLRPGGVVAISTEFRLEGPPPGLPGTLLFDEAELRAMLLEGLWWDPLDPLDLSQSSETLATEVPFSEALADQAAGKDSLSRYPHLVLRHGELLWTSVHVALVKSESVGDGEAAAPASLPGPAPSDPAVEEDPPVALQDQALVRQPAPPPQRPPERAALPAAREATEGGRSTTWGGPSRLGPFGRMLRRVLWRLLRPYDVRRREVEANLVRAIEEGGAPLHGGALQVPDPIVGIEVVEVDTPIGSFVLDTKDTLVRPALEIQKSWGYDVATLLEKTLEPGMRFLDVGSNIGYFSVLASRLVGPSGSVVAVEPDPVNLQLLRANLWRNGCFNVQVLPVAADARRGHVGLVIFPEGGAATETTRDASRYVLDDRVDIQDIGKIMAPTAPLDDLILPPVDVVKLDTQFTEPEVMEGLRETIAASPKLLIITEFGPEELRRRNRDPLAVLNGWTDLGFEIKLLRGTEEVFAPFETIVSAPNDMPLGNGPFFDMVMRKGYA
jgi:FkbM family methyltransferase